MIAPKREHFSKENCIFTFFFSIFTKLIKIVLFKTKSRHMGSEKIINTSILKI